MGPLHNIHRPMLAEASLALDSRLLGRGGWGESKAGCRDLEVLDAAGGSSSSDTFYMRAAIRWETVVPRATGWAKEREEARLLVVGGLALMHLCREGSAARARVVRATQASEI